MIDRRMVELYFGYDGDQDRMTRRRRRKELDAFGPDDWKLLGDLRMALANLKAGLVSDDFARRTRDELARQTDGPETARMLMDLA